MTGPDVSSDQLTWPVLERMRDCLCAAWDDLDVGDPPARCGIIPGRDVAADDCCDGMAWVRRVRTYPSSVENFPAELTAPDIGCPDLFWVVEVGVGVLRCAPSGQEVGDSWLPPTVAELEAAALQISDDEARVRRAVLCCFAAAPFPQEWGEVVVHYGQAISVGPEGGCHGFDVTVMVGRQNCPCDDDDE